MGDGLRKDMDTEVLGFSPLALSLALVLPVRFNEEGGESGKG